jgi:hypothetical protein
MKPINPGEHYQKNLNDCNEKSPLQENLNSDEAKPFCNPDTTESKRDTGGVDTSWLRDNTFQKEFGFSKQCDPATKGYQENNLENPSRNMIYKSENAIRGADQAIQDLFSDITVRDHNGKIWPVPIVYSAPQKAVAFITQSNIRKDNSMVVDKIKLPLLSIFQLDMNPDWARYTYHEARNYFRNDQDNKPGFYVKEKYERDTVFGVSRGIPVDINYQLSLWTMFFEDAAQIRQQILLKFSQITYIQIQGVHWESVVSLESISSNVEAETGESDRIIKYQFNIKLQTYIPQPIARRKAVLSTRIDLLNSVEQEEINELYARLEDSVINKEQND